MHVCVFVCIYALSQALSMALVRASAFIILLSRHCSVMTKNYNNKYTIETQKAHSEALIAKMFVAIVACMPMRLLAYFVLMISHLLVCCMKHQ